MLRLTTLAVFFISCSADPRAARVYNVLISSKKNLSPSHAQPVYERVLQTTSIGYEFPSFYYHTSFVQNVPSTYINPSYIGYGKTDVSLIKQNREVAQNDVPLTVPVSIQELQLKKQLNFNTIPQNQQELTQENQQTSAGQFIPQYNPYALNYQKYLPKNHKSIPEEQDATFALPREEIDPKKVIANLKKNPEIPDVPPPPLPVRTASKL